MKSKLFLLAILSSLVVLHSCEEPEVPNPLNLSDFLNNNKPALQEFTVQAGTASQITGAKGCTISFTANSFFKLDGTPISSGNIDIQLREVTTKKDMILSQTPTVNGNELLVSQGSYYLKALGNGFELIIKDFSINKTWTPVPPPQYELDTYLGGISGDNFNWVPSAGVTDTVSFTSLVDSINYTMTSSSTFLAQNYNWISCNAIQDYNNTNSVVALFFPTTENISVYNFQSYLIFKDEYSIIKYYSYGNNQLEFYNIPPGADATLVTYYIVEGKVFVATVDIETSDALSTPITFTETDEQGLLSILEGL